jgi:hypothetical protein
VAVCLYFWYPFGLRYCAFDDRWIMDQWDSYETQKQKDLPIPKSQSHLRNVNDRLSLNRRQGKNSNSGNGRNIIYQAASRERKKPRPTYAKVSNIPIS